MSQRMNESPLNPLPAVVWLLAMPVIASEAVFLLGRLGLIGGAEGIGLRMEGILMSAYIAEFSEGMWSMGAIDWGQIHRLVAYPFVNGSFMQALFVLAFTLALGNMIARAFRPWAVIALYLGSAAGGALIYTFIAPSLPGRAAPLIGGFPAVYGLVGGFTFLLWTRLAEVNASRYRAFTLIGMLLLFQLVFGVVFGSMGYGWIAEIAGFATGFGLSFLLVDGGLTRVLRQLRQR